MKWSENKINWLKKKDTKQNKMKLPVLFRQWGYEKGKSRTVTFANKHGGALSIYSQGRTGGQDIVLQSHQGSYRGQRRKAPATSPVYKPLPRLQEVGQHCSVTTELPLKRTFVFLTWALLLCSPPTDTTMVCFIYSSSLVPYSIPLLTWLWAPWTEPINPLSLYSWLS